MATLFDSASLVMIPSGYKDDKLYSIKPTDGSGDFTFSRDGSGASPATRVNASGLIEKGRTNELTYSNDFSNADWTKQDSSVTSGQSGYDGTNNAWELIESATTAEHVIRQTPSFGGVVTLSVYAKANTRDWLWLRGVTSGVNVRAWFDLTNGVLGSTAGSVIDYNIESVGATGWYRCSLTLNHDSAFEYYIGLSSTDGLGGYAGDGSSSIYIQDAQLEQGLVATAPAIETTTAPVSAGLLGDMPRLDYSGGATCPSLLLEPSRVNLFDHSEYMGGWSTSNAGVSIEENAITSPEGVVNAAKIKEDGTNAAHAVRQLTGPTLTSGTDYTFSFFAKKGERSIVALSNTIGASNDVNCFFDLENGQVLTNTFNSASIEDFGNGWYRCIATDTADAADDYDTRIYTATADNQFSHQGVSGNGLYIYGLQLEAGSYPTSYIPTYGSASTRGDDDCTLTSASALIGQTQGTLFVEATIDAAVDTESYLIRIETANFNDTILISRSAAGFLGATFRNNGSSVFSNFSQTISGAFKVAFRYQSGNFGLFINGASVASSAATYTNSITYDDVALGEFGGATAQMNGGIKQALVFPTALTDAECIALTTI